MINSFLVSLHKTHSGGGCDPHCVFIMMLTFITLHLIHTNEIFGSVSTTTEDRKKLVAWNCDLLQSLEFSEYSLIEVESCQNISSRYHTPILKNSQLIKSKDFQDLQILQCILKSSFYVAYCSYSVISGFRLWNLESQLENVFIKLTQKECENALNQSTLRYMDRNYYNRMKFIDIELSPAKTASGWKVLRGRTDAVEGTCVPESFQFNRNIFPSHVLKMKYDVTINYLPAVLNVKQRLIKINKDLVFPEISSGYFFSPILGNFYWTPIDKGNLTDNLWLEITKGEALIYKPKNNATMPIAVIKTSNRSNFAISLTGQTNLCTLSSCRIGYKSQIADTYLIVYNLLGQSHWPLPLVSGSEVDTLLNLEATTMSIYFQKELRLSNTFDQISFELCLKNRELILSNIKGYVKNVVYKEKNDYDYRYFLRAGSVLYSIKCFKTEAWLRNNDRKCYKDAPINYQATNGSIIQAFLDPLTSIILPNSIISPCNDILPFKLKIKNIDGSTEWVCKNHNGWTRQCTVPKVLEPLHTNLYNSDDKQILTTLYTNDQLSSLSKLQWDNIQTKYDVQTWNNYMDKMITKNENLQPIDQFTKIQKRLNELSYIFDLNFIMKHFIRIILPILITNYIVNVILNLFIGFMQSRQLYKLGGFTTRFVYRCMVTLAKSIFPLSLLMEQKDQHHERCKCNDEEFVDQLIVEIESKERQRFITNLQL